MQTNNNLKTLGSQAAHLIATLQQRRHLVFALAEVIEITGLRPIPASGFIRSLVNRGIVARLRPGLFTLVPSELGWEKEYMGNPYIIAREMMQGQNYYVSHASAMDIHGMTTQPQLVVYITSTKFMRRCSISGTEFRFIQCHSLRFFGFSGEWVNKEEKVLVSDLERTVLDGIRSPKHCGGITAVAKGFWMRHSQINVEKMVEYALRLDIGSVMARLGHLMEVLNIGSQQDLKRLKQGIGSAYLLLDPTLPSEGKYLARWKLRINVPSEEINAALQT